LKALAQALLPEDPLVAYDSSSAGSAPIAEARTATHRRSRNRHQLMKARVCQRVPSMTRFYSGPASMAKSHEIGTSDEQTAITPSFRLRTRACVGGRSNRFVRPSIKLSAGIHANFSTRWKFPQ